MTYFVIGSFFFYFIMLFVFFVYLARDAKRDK